jgi:glutamate dehydrogenase
MLEKRAEPDVDGLEAEKLEQLTVLPELAHAACALHISSMHQMPLNRCLAASRACMQLLPIRAMEQQLRSSDWGSADAHSLRREWLQRLVNLKEKAIFQLLEKGGNHYEATAKTRWHQHSAWENIENFMHENSSEDSDTNQPAEPRRAESRRMQLLLALTRLESIIES